MGAGLRTTSKGAERPPDPNVSCAAFLSRQPHVRFDERDVETEPDLKTEPPRHIPTLPRVLRSGV